MINCINFRLRLIVLLCVLFAFGCGETKKEVDWDGELAGRGEFGYFYSRYANPNCTAECRWKKVSPSVLRFSGPIRTGTYEEFLAAVDDQTLEIELNSGGGSVKVALEIAKVISQRKFNVTVTGLCISSCANYLFLAGETKTIKGIVGFHGSAQSIGDQNCFAEPLHPRCKTNQAEQIFFQGVGVNSLLFEVTQSVDKGKEDGGDYAYYAPSVGTLNALGISGLKGYQNPEFLSHLDQLHKKFGINEFNVATDPNPRILRGLRSAGIPTSSLK